MRWLNYVTKTDVDYKKKLSKNYFMHPTTKPLKKGKWRLQSMHIYIHLMI